MALQLKNNGPDEDEPAREYYGSSWTESTTAREAGSKESGEGSGEGGSGGGSDGESAGGSKAGSGGNAPDMPEFNPELEFDAFKVPDGVEKEEKEFISQFDTTKKIDNSLGPFKDKTNEKLIKTAIGLVVLAAIILIIKLVFFPAPRDLTSCTKLSEPELEIELRTTFKRDENMDKFIPHWLESGTFEAKSGKGLYTFSIDGEYKGFHIDKKRYTLYGLTIGERYDVAEMTFNFPYTGSFFVVNDLANGVSTADYYYNESTNECVIVTINNNSGQVVAITYTNDYRKMTENLSHD